MKTPDDFPKAASESAQAILGGEAVEARTPLETVSTALNELMARRTEYFDSFDPTSPQESRRERITRELQAAQDEITNAPPPRTHKKINIFSAQQSRDDSDKTEFANSQTLEDLYSTLNQVAGLGKKDYHDIRSDAEAAKKDNHYARDDYPYRFLTDSSLVALSNSKNQLFGVQLKIAPNIFAAFTLDNLEYDSAPHDANVVLTVIVGESTTRR